jgi:hypothetical protein
VTESDKAESLLVTAVKSFVVEPSSELNQERNVRWPAWRVKKLFRNCSLNTDGTSNGPNWKNSESVFINFLRS